MPAQRRGRHPMCSQRELLIGGKDDQAVSGECRVWIKAQQGVEHTERPLGHAESWPRDANRAEHLPLMDNLVRRPGGGDELRCHMGKRHRSPPEGRRWLMCLHVFASVGQRKSAHRNGATLDSDSRKGVLMCCHTTSVGPSGAATFRGAFFFCLNAPRWCWRERRSGRGGFRAHI